MTAVHPRANPGKSGNDGLVAAPGARRERGNAIIPAASAAADTRRLLRANFPPRRRCVPGMIPCPYQPRSDFTSFQVRRSSHWSPTVGVELDDEPTIMSDPPSGRGLLAGQS